MIDVMKMLSDPALQMGLGIMGTPTGTGTVTSGIARGAQRGALAATAMQKQLESLKAAQEKRAYEKQRANMMANWNPDMDPDLRQASSAGLMTVNEAMTQQRLRDKANAPAPYEPVKQFQQERAGQYMASLGPLKGSKWIIMDDGTLTAKGQVLAHKISQLAAQTGDYAGATTQVLQNLENQGILRVGSDQIKVNDAKFQDWMQGGGQLNPAGMTPEEATAAYPEGFTVAGEDTPVSTGGEAPAPNDSAKTFAAEDTFGDFNPIPIDESLGKTARRKMAEILGPSPYQPKPEDPFSPRNVQIAGQQQRKKLTDRYGNVGLENLMRKISGQAGSLGPPDPTMSARPGWDQGAPTGRTIPKSPQVNIGNPTKALQDLAARQNLGTPDGPSQPVYDEMKPVGNVPDITPPQTDSSPLSGVTTEPDEFTQRFDMTMKSVENNVRTGYDERSDTWKPHKSREGGPDTIGWGHKLTPAEVKSGKIKIGDTEYSYRDGLPTSSIDELYQQDKRRIESQVMKTFPEYADLPKKYQGVILNIAYNTGKFSAKGWPKLTKAMMGGDDATVKREMLTTAVIGGKRRPLTSRRDQFAKVLLGI